MNDAATAPAESAHVTLIGVVVVDDAFDIATPIGGLAPLLRHALGFQAAGAQAVVLLGASTALPSAQRLAIPVLRALPSHDRALVVRADVTAHRALPQRLAALPCRSDEVAYAGDERAALVSCGAQRTEASVTALASTTLPENARRESLVGEGAFAEFVLPAATAGERRAATERHLRSLRKPTGGVLENLYMRPLSMQMTRVLCRTSITPNAMSVVTLFVALLAGALIALPDPRYSIAGGLLHIWMRVVDCIDGELARLKYQSSRFGEWLDTIGDGLGMAAFVGGTTLHAMQSDPGMGVIGVIGIVAWLLVQALQVAGAVLEGQTGTFHRVQWGHRSKQRSLPERFVGSIEMALRIDAISTYYGIAVALGAHRALLYVHATVALVASAYFGVQVLKVARRAAAATQSGSP